MTDLTLLKIDLIGTDTEAQAFDQAKLDEAGIIDDELRELLKRHIGPAAHLLKDGCGVAIVMEGENAHFIGVKVCDATQRARVH